MRKRILIALAGALVALVVPQFASAQATRTWVSAVGDDANPCSRTAPCKTFAGAISKTASGGIINVLDPGGYGALTITKPITITGPPGMGEILSSGVQGIVINITTPNPKPVILRNLDISGTGTTYGTNGIHMVAGRTLRLQNINIDSYSNIGLLVTEPNARVFSQNLEINDVPTGILFNAGGTLGLAATFKHTDITAGMYGIRAYGASPGTNVNLSDCAISDESAAGIFAQGVASIQVSDCDLHNNVTAISSDAASIRVSNSIITNNSTGISAINGGSVLSRGNNTLTDNGAGNAFTGMFGPQ